MAEKEIINSRKIYGFETSALQTNCYSSLNQWVACYFQIWMQVQKLLKDYYASISEKDEKISLPVPVVEIAEWLGFNLQRKPLNTARNANLGMVLGRLECQELQKTIFLEESYNLTYEQERYAIANLLGQYYVGRNSKFAECAEVRLPSDNSEIMAMLFTTFLIFPPKPVFAAANLYADIEKRPINQELMLMDLSKKARIPYYYTVVCYEHLRILASYARMKDFEKILESIKEKQVGDEVLQDTAQTHKAREESTLLEFPFELAPEKFFY